MRKVILALAAGALLAACGVAEAEWSFCTGQDTMTYTITTWSIRTDWAGTWAGKTPTYFMFNAPSWPTRYTNTSGVQYWPGQPMTGTAVGTDVFSDADLDAIGLPAEPGWATMTGCSSPISFWDHGGQFLHTSGGNDASWADDTYWASNEYGSPRATGVTTEYLGSFWWNGVGANRVEGKILADDWAQVYINNTLVYTTDSRAYDQVESFAYDGALVAGSNSVKAIVYDTGQGSEAQSPTAGPTALQLALVPEPASVILLGLCGLGLTVRKRGK